MLKKISFVFHLCNQESDKKLAWIKTLKNEYTITCFAFFFSTSFNVCKTRVRCLKQTEFIMVLSLCACFALSTQDLFSTAFDHQSYFNFFQGFKFERENVFLGQIPPRITGIKVVSSSKYYHKGIFNFL